MWDKLINRKRYKGEDGIVQDAESGFHRNDFHKDYDRLIFSNAFRRLSRKTQVHPLSRNDHVHNRLTHSLEVASVGRSLGLKAGRFLKGSLQDGIGEHDVAYIVQTACLAHDIGNPPFGHAGEEVIKEWFSDPDNKHFLAGLTEQEVSDLQRLDGNAQSFRIVTQLENHFLDGGMHLTLPTIGCLVKYPYSSECCEETGKDKFNYFATEQPIFDQVFTAMGLKKPDGRYRRHPLSYLMEAADDICYGMLDIQDAVELKLLSENDLHDIFSDSAVSFKNLARNTAGIINELTENIGMTFENNIGLLLSDQQPGELISLSDNQRLTDIIKNSKTISRDKIFNDKRKVELELGAYNIIETILSCLIPAVCEYHEKQDLKGLSFRNKRALELMGKERPDASMSRYEMYRRVIDYLVGMTDNYAQFTANQLNGVAE